ncbi:MULTISPECIES: glycosyl transferase [Alphaproteobacteria]|uniref:Glycosyl transferase n=2 Tax=Alphaproteobacteria TaxID=28211 RepID=A0A512HLX9_9HYPH|nr:MULTISPECIES: glycosyl transferase [Alphaproteobacteria]GEO86451.1 glycosyl transferase [Ciceribacter naphthalenivorans]GLR22329.1 glycosyl transferase [Ciceribacter naphthalenivorans]GLT05185.1 glycosyl transferase [Sphingomonas psychrolutea]
MADFHQNGVVATLHNLRERSLERMEREIEHFAATRPITLILPSLYSELEAPALEHIVSELAQVPYISEIVIGLDQASREQFEHAKTYFSRLPQKHVILWNDGPRLKAIDAQLDQASLAPDQPGKGRNVWYCIGYVLGARSAGVVALHDCDITTYSRDMLARLVYPVTNPGFPYVFAKGYYPRIADRSLNGRVTRLLVTPLLLSLENVIGHHPYIDYLKAFRYPLAGEFAMRAHLLPDIRIPSDWGLEIGVLSELWRNYSNNAICQVDIADSYDHKHQALSADDAASGLSRMSIDIAKSLLRKLATDGVTFSQESLRTLKATYYRNALDLVEIYHNDARMNGLTTDRHKEEQAVELFAANLIEAGNVFLDNPNATPFMPSWNRVQSALPDLIHEIQEAVRKDSED